MSEFPRILSLFSGCGGLDLAVQSVLGGEVVAHAEIEPGACRILEHRFPGVPNVGDVSAVDWSTVGPVDVLCGGFPCQDVSAAGKRAGIAPGTRSGLWAEMARAIQALRPPLVVIENVRGLLSADAHHPAHGDLEPCPWCLGDDEPVLLRALGAVLGDLADIGFDAEWVGLRAADVGASHGRFRVFAVAWPAADTDRLGRERGWRARHGRDGSANGAVAPPHPEGDGWHEGRPEPARLIGGSDAALGGDDAAADLAGRGVSPECEGHCSAAADAECRGCAPADADARGALRTGGPEEGGEPQPRRAAPDAGRGGSVDWGNYEPAIRRWERCLGRPAPAPTELSAKGTPRLSPAFVEWLMGLPAGWVTDVPGLTRNEQLKALGNGVVPQQAAAALRMLLHVRDGRVAATRRTRDATVRC